MARTYSGGIPFKRKPISEFDTVNIFPKRIFLSLPEDGKILYSESDIVKKHALICEKTESSPAVYSGVGGKIDIIRKIGNRVAVSILADNNAETEEALPTPDKILSELSSEELESLLLERGVDCPKKGKKEAKLLIVDCGGSQYNYSRLYVCREFPREVVGGAKILMKLLGARNCIFAIPKTELEAAQSIENWLPNRSKMLKISLYKEKMPANIPHLVVSAICSVEINGMRNVFDSGYPVISPLLCLDVYRALALGEPCTGGFLTVSIGENKPVVAQVPFGTELSETVSVPDGHVAVRAEGVFGQKIRGVMSRKVEAVRVIPDSKLSLTDDSVCIGCLRCASVCPAHLLPYRIYRNVMSSNVNSTLSIYSTGCLECNACSAICPSKLPLSETIIKLRRTNEAVAAQIVEDQLQEDLRRLNESMMDNLSDVSDKNGKEEDEDDE